MKPNVRGMIGTVGKPWGARDSDGDKHINAIDCKPYDPKKQGAIHDWWERRKLKKAGVSEEKARAWQSHRKETVAKARAEAKLEGEEKYIREREKIKTSKKLKYYKEGGFWGSVSRGMTPPRPAARTVTVRRKGKKGKRTRTVAVPQPPKRKSISDFHMEL